MRFLIAAALIASLLMSSSVKAQNNSATGHNYGGITCPQHVSCSDDFSRVESFANACITQYFGFTNSDGFFESALGLDSNNCLVTKENVLPKYATTRTTPHCCVSQIQDDECAVHCDLVGAQ